METLENLRADLEEIKARSAADTAFLRCAIFTMSTAQLRGTEISLKKLGEDVATKLIYSSESDGTNQAFSERTQFWLSAIEAEVAAREAA